MDSLDSIWTDNYVYAALTIALGSCINEVFPLLALGIALYFFIDRKGVISMLHPRDLFKRTYLVLYALVSISISLFLLGRYLQLRQSLPAIRIILLAIQ